VAPAIERTEIDGVPFFWMADGPRQMANLRFRVGRSDEPFRVTGITHLLEHLAFHRIGERKFPVNGSVDHVVTEFVSVGRPDENASFMGDIAGALGDIDAERLTREARVLRVEDDGRGPNPIREFINLRYGAANLGRSALNEHALHVAGPADLRAWSAHWFTAGNAIGWMSHEPPAGMRLTLPAGERQPVIQHQDISPLPLPSWGPTQMPGAMVGAAMPRSAAAVAMAHILRDRAEHRLRRDLGISYDVSTVYLKLNRDDALVMVIASSRDEDAAQAGAELVGVVERLASEGPTAEELADELDGMQRAHADPMWPLGQLNYAAECELFGSTYMTPEELQAEAAALRPNEVQATATWFRDNAAGFSRNTPRLGPPWQAYPVWSAGSVGGRTFDSVRKKYPWTKGTPSLIVGDAGVSLMMPEGQCITVRYAGLAGMVRFNERRVLIGEDGFRLNVDPVEWKDGAQAAFAMDRAVPADQQVTWLS